MAAKYPALGGQIVYLNDPRYGIYSQSTDFSSRVFYYRAPDTVLLLYKIADKEGALIAYRKQVVRGVNAWVPKGIRVVPWDTNTELENFTRNLLQGVSIMLAFYALAPALGYGLAYASVGMFGEAFVSLLPVGQKYAMPYITDAVKDYFD